MKAGKMNGHMYPMKITAVLISAAPPTCLKEEKTKSRAKVLTV
jgi:hypothetical protein